MRRNANEMLLEENDGHLNLTRMIIEMREEGEILAFISAQSDWCKEFCKGDFAPHYDPAGLFVFLFADPADAFAYRMRWQ
jgi:hypothetical protein